MADQSRFFENSGYQDRSARLIQAYLTQLHHAKESTALRQMALYFTTFIVKFVAFFLISLLGNFTILDDSNDF